MQKAKDQVRKLLDELPDDATLNDIQYALNDRIYTLHVREQIELGMQESREGKTTPHAEVKKRFSRG